jgi:hypothetical protein
VALRVLAYSLVPGPNMTVYAPEVAALSRNTGVDGGVLLGIVMAHEIGHVLLNSNSHSAQGIMVARWRAEDLRAAERRALRFLPGEIRMLRYEVASRDRMAAVAVASRLGPGHR